MRCDVRFFPRGKRKCSDSLLKIDRAGQLYSKGAVVKPICLSHIAQDGEEFVSVISAHHQLLSILQN